MSRVLPETVKDIEMNKFPCPHRAYFLAEELLLLSKNVFLFKVHVMMVLFNSLTQNEVNFTFLLGGI